MRHPDVLLISMPFLEIEEANIGVAILQGVLKQRGIDCKNIYYHLSFAADIGRYWNTYVSIKTPTSDLVGEWLFSGSVFDQSDDNVEAYLHEILCDGFKEHWAVHTADDGGRGVSKDVIERLLTIRNERIEPFLDRCLQEILEYNPKIVGFTSVFQQQLASLALAKRLKKALPECKIIFGGPNNEREMGREVIRQFDFVDAVVSGEGEVVFPELVERCLTDQAFDNLSGVFTRKNLSKGVAMIAPSPNLDENPYPDYDDYFEQHRLLFSDQGEVKHQISVETSRGCWWGQKSHCTFCGLNGSTMGYRSKAQRRALDEIVCLKERYGIRSISVTDNILDMGYFKDFVPNLAALNLDLDMFYEIKSNMRKKQVSQLAYAGIRTIQPGIESLSDHVLELMRKGVTGMQNIQLLKWSKEYAMQCLWNVLWGFPGETAEDYREMSEAIPLFSHLQPPQGASEIRIDRFSPNHEQSQAMGFINVRPYRAYKHIYTSLPDTVVNNLAYFFAADDHTYGEMKRYTQPVNDAIESWREDHEGSALFYVDKENYMLVFDFRPIALENQYVLNATERLLLLECDAIRSLQQLEKIFSSEELQALDKLVNSKLIFRKDHYYLSLAVQLGDYQPNADVLDKLSHLSKQFAAA